MTGTHGTGSVSVTNLVKSMDVIYVDSDGVHHRRISDPLDLRDWLMSMGELGIVLDVDLETVPEFKLSITKMSSHVTDVESYLNFCVERGDCRGYMRYWPIYSDKVAHGVHMITNDTIAGDYNPFPIYDVILSAFR